MKKSTLLAEFDQAVHIVDSSISSLFTKPDVIRILRNLEDALKEYTSEKELIADDSKVLTTEQIDSLIEIVTLEVKDMGEEIIYDYDLSMNYKEVEIDSVDLHYDNIKETVEKSIQDWFKNLNEDDCGC
jgi:hypothetical protein